MTFCTGSGGHRTDPSLNLDCIVYCMQHQGSGVASNKWFTACSSSSLGGSIATIIIYGFCLLQGANYLSDGSEMLLEILDPGLIGGARRVIHDCFAEICCPACTANRPHAGARDVPLLVSCMHNLVAPASRASFVVCSGSCSHPKLESCSARLQACCCRFWAHCPTV